MVQKEPSYWLMKSEPDAYSIDTLKNERVTLWGRNKKLSGSKFHEKNE